MSRSHILPVEIFTGAQSYEGIGAAEHTEDANLIIVLKLKTRHHYACSENFLRQMYIGGIEPRDSYYRLPKHTSTAQRH